MYNTFLFLPHTTSEIFTPVLILASRLTFLPISRSGCEERDRCDNVGACVPPRLRAITPAGARPPLPHKIHKHQLTARQIKQKLKKIFTVSGIKRLAREQRNKKVRERWRKREGAGAKKKRKLTKQALIKTVRHLWRHHVGNQPRSLGCKVFSVCRCVNRDKRNGSW